MARNSKLEEKKCLVCGTSFLGCYDKKYCKKSCRDAHSNKRKKFVPEERKCKYCHSTFTAKRKDNLYCNNKCKDRFSQGVPLQSDRDEVRERQKYVIFSGIAKGIKPTLSDYQVFGETLDKKIVAMTEPLPMKKATEKYKDIRQLVYTTDSRGEYIGDILNCWLCQPAKPCPHKAMHNGKTCAEASKNG